MTVPATNELFTAVREAILATYGERLVRVAVFGSWARGSATPASDLDLLVVAEATRAARKGVWSADGLEVELLPVFKTPAKLEAGSPLHLDMTLWAIVLLDRGGVLASLLAKLGERMKAIGSRRVPFKGGAFWDYKPDLRPGEVVER